jgi:hypothetical protein
MTLQILPQSVSADASQASEEPRCPNCREPLLGEFCYACGQPKKGFIRHLSGIVGDFLDTVFNIDSRTLRTVFPLFFRPGFLSIEYFEGRRVRYVTPLRLYFFFSVIAFLAVSWVAHVDKDKSGDWYVEDGAAQEADPKEIENQRRVALEGLEKARPFMGEEGFKEASTAIDQRFDAMLEKARKPKPDTRKSPPRIPVPGGSIRPPQPPGAVGAPDPAPATAPDDAAGSDDDDEQMNIQLSNGTSWDPLKDPVNIGWLNASSNAWLTQQAQRIVNNAKHIDDDPNRFLGQVFSLAPQTLFVMLPLFALMLKCFYIFKRRLYMEHLIVALHSHSFLCLAILMLVGINAVQGAVPEASSWQWFLGLVNFLMWWWIPIYLLIAQKRIYRQGWIMTLIKYCMIGFAYSILISLGIVANMIFSLASL